MARSITITIDYDQDTECPIGASGDKKEKIVIFNRNSTLYANPNEYLSGIDRYGEVIPASIGLTKQLQSETAFIISCYEHGQVCYSLQGSGTQCRFDTAQIAGIYWLPSDVPKDRRREYAKGTLETFSDWCNGICYYYSIEENGDTLDSCGGFIGSDPLIECLRESVQGLDLGDDATFEFVGEAGDLMLYYDLKPKREVVV